MPRCIRGADPLFRLMPSGPAASAVTLTCAAASGGLRAPAGTASAAASASSSSGSTIRSPRSVSTVAARAPSAGSPLRRSTCRFIASCGGEARWAASGGRPANAARDSPRSAAGETRRRRVLQARQNTPHKRALVPAVRAEASSSRIGCHEASRPHIESSVAATVRMNFEISRLVFQTEHPRAMAALGWHAAVLPNVPPAPQHRVTIAGVPVSFPFQPYPSQLALASQVARCGPPRQTHRRQA
jgi:hypothetical protein